MLEDINPTPPMSWVSAQQRRWRRRGKRHDRPHSLKVSAMASPSAQYIFGEFSDDEFKQFFVSARCTVELPPFNESASYGPQTSSDLQDGDEYQRIEFGVGDAIDPDAERLGNSDFSISSTLNPQAPEFILACAPAQKAAADDPLTDSCDAAEGGGSGNADSDGTSGLGQRERKKKKKRPPGYYSYLEGVAGDGPAHTETLVNGHGEDAAEEEELPAAPASPRTCDSPELPADYNGEDLPVALDNDRTAGQPEERSVTPPRSPSPPPASEEGGGGRESPLRTATEPAAPQTTETPGVSNGQTLEPAGEEPDSSNGLGHAPQSEPAKPEDLFLPLPGAQAVASASSAPPPAKSWASLFHNSKPSASPQVAYVETKYSPPPADAATTQEAEKQAEQENEGPVPVSEDPLAIKIAEVLENVKLVHKPVSLQPRGLINKGNWCYINAILQALVACPPMYHLMKCIPMYTRSERPCTSTPMMDSFVQLMNEFTNMPVVPKAKQVPGDKVVRDIRPGAPFEPTYIYQLLTLSKSTLSEKGRQEDAEEYLGYVLNGLHEEMLSLKKLLHPENDRICLSNGPDPQLPPSSDSNEANHRDQGEASEEEWEQVGPRNKSLVTRQADFIQTPITDIFGGHMRSVVYQQSSKESATLQPFFTLQLDIQSEKIRTVQDALESLVAREAVQGYTTKTKQEVEISRRVTLEELPPVLVLHLKRFIFEKTGGCQKLVKNIEYPVDLEISKDLLSPGVKSKIFKGQRTYRLFAVVYHHGNSATGGHYTTDVFQIGLSGWLRIDDQAVKVVNQFQVVKPSAERAAYLLYYRRVDLL
ncbi:ubiquitin carboxyl-terminal hydrolase 10 [Gastrophryne carolinensis]